jgi:hypothetical protein
VASVVDSDREFRRGSWTPGRLRWPAGLLAPGFHDQQPDGEDADQVVAGGRHLLARLDVDTYPEIAAHVRWHVEGPSDGDDAFTFGLNLILDGVEQARDAMSST